MLKKILLAIFFIANYAFNTCAGAANLVVQVLDKEGQPVLDAVVVVVPASKAGSPKNPLPGQFTVHQEKMRFSPSVSLVALGAKAQFVNNDPWDHHVRASAAGVAQFNAGAGGFELRIDGRPDGKPANTAVATFSKAGAVLLGCHIHGSMRAHVYVSDSPWAALTGPDGLAQLDQLPEGPSQIRLWHADQLLDIAAQAHVVTATPGRLTLQLGVVPRRRRI